FNKIRFERGRISVRGDQEQLEHEAFLEGCATAKTMLLEFNELIDNDPEYLERPSQPARPSDITGTFLILSQCHNQKRPLYDTPVPKQLRKIARTIAS